MAILKEKQREKQAAKLLKGCDLVIGLSWAALVIITLAAGMSLESFEHHVGIPLIALGAVLAFCTMTRLPDKTASLLVEAWLFLRSKPWKGFTEYDRKLLHALGIKLD